MKFAIKTKGYQSYYLCDGTIRVSHSGNRILTISQCDKISRSSYYGLSCPRFNIFFDPELRHYREIHEIGNSDVFAALEAAGVVNA